MQKNTQEIFLEILFNRIKYAAKQVGAISTCVTLCVFGLGTLLFPAGVSASIALAVFGFCGMLEAFHLQRYTEVKKLSQPDRVNALLERLVDTHKWNPKIIKEFSYCDFCFNIIGFDKLPLPIGVSNPLCPTCHQVINLELIQCKFPGRVSITIQCACGYTVSSHKTIAELKMEAGRLGGIPC